MLAGGFYISPALPAGLSFNTTTGIISGTSTLASPATNYTVTAYNMVGHTATMVNIAVVLPPRPTISYASPKVYVTGTAITALAPTKSGVAAAGYSGAAVAIGSGFNFPLGVATDAAGNVYVADNVNANLVEVPAGNGTPVVINSSFSSPAGVAVDAAGNIYVADFNATTISELPAGGGAMISIGSGFNEPSGVAVDAAGNVYVADSQNNAVKEIPVGGGAPVSIGTGFSAPAGVAVDAAGNVYVADQGNNAVKKIPGGGATVIVGSGFSSPSESQ